MKHAGAAASRPAPPARAREPLALALVLLAALWLHRDAWRAPFFADDYLFLDRVAGRSWWQALVAPDPIGNYLRPFGRQLWFWALSMVPGASPAAFHTANLALFLIAIVLLWSLVRRRLGARAALIAASLLALQHAADVPILWASGSQDLLALVFALAALLLFSSGRRVMAAIAFLLALLAKEVVALTPLVAMALVHRPGERWSKAVKSAWPLLVTLGLWGAALLLVAARRPLFGLDARVHAADWIATPLHLLQTVAGLEWSRGGWTPRVPPLALLPVVGALLWQASRAGKEPEPPPRTVETVATGAAWALLGAAPVVAVAGIWSAYYFLFAACGAAWALAAAVARRPSWVGALVVALLGWSCECARRLPEFATASDPWATCSHVNRHYLERGMAATARYLEDLRRARPTLPPRSTLFFSRLPSQVAFQTGDGPLVRWAYRDTTLRSFFLTRFRLEDARRGRLFFFQAWHDSLLEVRGADSLQRIGLGLLLSGAPAAARDVWRLEHERDPGSTRTAYRLAWVEAHAGRADSSLGWLARSGARAEAGPTPETALAFQRLSTLDTTAAIAIASEGALRHALDPGIHALLADLLLVHQGVTDDAVIEGYAAWTLAPRAAASWRRWGMICFFRDRNGEALAALERYFALAGPAAASDAEAARILAEVRSRLPGGALAQQAVRGGPGAPEE